VKIKTKHKIVVTVAIIASLLGVPYGVNKYQSEQQIQKVHQLVTSEFHLDTRTKTSDCKIKNSLPDPACTPGSIFATTTKTQICTKGYSSGVRDVSTKDKNKVYTEYDIKTRTTGQYEVDHFISLELGGSNDIANLWPQAASPIPGFHEKDKVENYLHNQLCSGKISLAEAQLLISAKWVEVYNLIYTKN
jgi:hypothetical protein